MIPDFYIPSHNLIIEYNGIQHYKPVCFNSISKEKSELNFIKQQLRDENMRKYCLENNIFLLEIDGRIYQSQKLKKFLINYFNERIV